MLKIAVCDDDFVICGEIEKIILDLKTVSGINLEVETFCSGVELCEFIKNKNQFDLIFLDIEMPDFNGVQVGKVIRYELQDYITKIVYISGRDGYDRQLFEMNPLDFLSKPIDREKVIAKIKLVLEITKSLNETFSYKTGHTMHKVPMKDILYFEGDRRKVSLISTTDSIGFYGSIKEILPQLIGKRFIQIHRSYIINYDYIYIIKPEMIIMQNRINLPISRDRRIAVRTLLTHFELEDKNRIERI